MNDPRFTWIKHFSSDYSKITVVIPKGIKSPGLESLYKFWNNELQPKIIENGSCYSTFVPLSKNTIDNRNCEVLIYILKNRESTNTIQKKLFLEGQSPLAEYLIFPGPKNPRWFIPKWRSLGPGKMSRMIQPSTFIARTAVAIYRLLSGIKLSHLVFPCRLIVTYIQKSNTRFEGNKSIINFFQETELGIKAGIVYSGSYGPLQKFTIELMQNSTDPFAYAKFGHNKYTTQAISNEKHTLKKLYNLKLKKIQVPELLELPNLPEKFASQLLIVRTLDGGEPLNHASKKAIAQGLSELYNATRQTGGTTIELFLTEQMKSLQKQESHIDNNILTMRDDLISILKNLITDMGEAVFLTLSLSHGDFTRWNVRSDEETIYVIDWEEAAMRPPGHDLLSFILAEYLLVTQLTPQKVTHRMIEEVVSGGLFNDFLNTIRTSDPCLDVDEEFLGICFFIEIFCSNLWHFRKHRQYQYVEKKSLTDLMETAWLCCLQLNKIRERKINNS